MVTAEKNIFADDVRAAKLAEERYDVAVIIARITWTDFSVHAAKHNRQIARDGKYIS